MSAEQLTGPQLAIALLAQIGDDDSDAAIAAVHDLADEHAQRLTLQHHAADQVWRIADLEVKCVTLKEPHDAAADERDNLIDAMREEIDEGLRLRELGGALPHENITAMTERVIKERDALRARMAEIEVQEPVAKIHSDGYWTARRGYDPLSDNKAFLSVYARPVTAQAVPDADGARFRWLCEDHSDRETRERCRSLIDRLPVMSYSDAVMSIDAAMAAAPEHKA